MHTQTWHHIQAPIEAPDDSEREAAREEAVETISGVLFREYVKDPARHRDALQSLESAKYDAIEAAYFQGAQAYYEAAQRAVLRYLKDAAIEQAKRDVDAIDREDEGHYAAERMER